MINTDEIYDNCPVLELYYLLGKKWTCPIIMSIEQDKNYSFEDIIKLTSRKINRTLLSNLLKEMILFKIINYEENYYKISEKGLRIRNNLEELKKLFLNEHSKDEICYLKSNCLISNFHK